MAEHRVRQLQFAAMASASAPRDSAALPHPVRDDSGFRLRAGLVLVLAAILFFARLGARALWSSEFRWAEIAREMIVTHNYFWPTINGHVYYDKPLGSYWLVIFSTPFTGGLNEAATRLPCAIAGLLAVAAAHAAHATPLRRSHRDTLRRDPRDQLQLRILFARRQRRRRDHHRRTRRAAALQSQRGARRRNLGRRSVADHGRDLAHQRPARIRAAAVDDRRVLMPARRLVAIFSGDLQRLDR